MAQAAFHDRIAVDPQVCGGRPRVRGTRIEVVIILDALAEGFTPAQIIDHYPALTVDDVHAAAEYGAGMCKRK